MSENLVNYIKYFVSSISIKNFVISFIQKYKLHYVALLLLIAYLLAVRILLIFSYSLDLEGAEYSFVHFVQTIQYFKTLYQNPTDFPFINCVYNPFYPYLIWLIAKVIGLDFTKDIYYIFIIGRVISLVCVFIQIVYLIKLIRLFERNKTIVLIGVLLYLLLITGHFYAMRPDAMVTTLFSVFVYHTVVYFYQETKRIYWIKSGVLILFMILLKQDSIIHILLFSGVLFLLKRTKTTFFLMVLFVVIVILTIIVLYTIFGADYIYNTVLFNFQITSNIRYSYNLVMVSISICRVLPLLVLSLLLYTKYYQQQNKDLLLLFLLTGFFEFIISHLLMFRAGSNINYAYVTILYLVISCSVLMHLPQQKKYKAFIIFFFYLVVVIGTNMVLKNYSFSISSLKKQKTEYDNLLAARDNILDYTGTFLFFMPYPKYNIFLFTSNLIYGYDFHIDRYLYLITGFKSTTSLAYVNSDKYDSYFTDGRVKYILLENNIKNEAYMKIYYPEYVLTDSVNIFQIYEYEKIKIQN